jgi:hypothetical protein
VADSPRLAISIDIRDGKIMQARPLFADDFFADVFFVLKKRLYCPRVETASRLNEATAVKICGAASLPSIKSAT